MNLLSPAMKKELDVKKLMKDPKVKDLVEQLLADPKVRSKNFLDNLLLFADPKV